MMNQTKIGRFISSMRKEKGLTQRQLADELGISDKTVSKWETGKGLPEVALMLPLCEILNITVYELLCGEKLAEADYKQKAEETIMNLIQEKEQSKKNIVLEIVTVFITLLASLTLIIIAGYLQMENWLRILLIVIGFIVIIGGITVACVLELQAGTFECRHCNTRFVPTAKAFIAGPHTLTTRYLKCPECGKKSYCKKRLTH